MRALLIVMLALGSWSSLAEQVPGEGLLSYFRASCQTHGEWTRSALADSTALIGTLNSMAADPDCRTVSGAIAGLGTLNNQVNAMSAMSANQAQISQLDSQEQELLVQLANSSDPVIQAELNGLLRNLQITRSSYLGRSRYDREWSSPTRVSLMANLVQVANATFTQLAANPRCLDKHPT